MAPFGSDSTFFTNDLGLTAQHKPALSSFFSAPHHSGKQDGAQKREHIRSAAKGHEALNGFTPFSFDYVVVGGGTAGLTLASRLAESLEPGQYVCVIEAGTYHQDPVIDVPGLWGVACRNLDYDWTYETVPQPSLKGRKMPCSAGRLLGGSSGINFLAKMRASSPEYDAWDEYGNGWDWKGILPYFKAQESYTPYEQDQIFPGITKEEDEEARRREPEFRGSTGPIHSTHNSVYTDMVQPTIEALSKFGVKTNRTPGDGDSTGVFNMDTAINRKEGTRSYAANAYLQDPKSTVPQANVVLLKGIYVTKILFDSDNGKGAKATGLVCLGGVDWKSTDGSTFPFVVNIKKELIVSAGAYNTPRLLELSGIGNPSILSRFNITPMIDLAIIGENLQNHINLRSDFIVKDHVFTLDRLRNDGTFRAEQEQEYRDNKTGVFATSLSAYAFIRLKDFLSEEEVEELKEELSKEIVKANDPLQRQLLMTQRGFLDNDGVADLELMMIPKVTASSPKENTSYITILAVSAHPVARGSVHISSSDPLAPPSINPNYLNNPYDVKLMTKAAMFVRRLSETAPLKDIIVAPSTPGPEIETEVQFEEFVHARLGNMDHPSCTVPMAPRSLGGAVDEDLRVYGTQNVRVADMSITPFLVSGHCLDTAYAIGEKVATLIKAGISAQ